MNNKYSLLKNLNVSINNNNNKYLIYLNYFAIGKSFLIIFKK